MNENTTYPTIALCCLNEIRKIADKSDDYSSFKCNLVLRINELIEIIEKENRRYEIKVIPM